MMTSSNYNLFDAKNYALFINRIEQLQPTDKPLWGKMNAAQMLAHCAEIQEVANGKELQTTFIFRLLRGFVRKTVLNDKPYKKGIPTHPQYVTDTTTVAFEEAKKRLLKALKTMYEKKGVAEHPYLGRMTEQERSWGMYKHHDHHLQQFGV
jgi:hypothetical protein